MLKKIIASIVLVLVLLGSVFTASAAGETYVKVDVPGNVQEHRLVREMYEATQKLYASDFGLEESFKGISDIFYSEASGILLLCGSESKVVRINEKYTKATIIKIV